MQGAAPGQRAGCRGFQRAKARGAGQHRQTDRPRRTALGASGSVLEPGGELGLSSTVGMGPSTHPSGLVPCVARLKPMASCLPLLLILNTHLCICTASLPQPSSGPREADPHGPHHQDCPAAWPGCAALASPPQGRLDEVGVFLPGPLFASEWHLW